MAVEPVEAVDRNAVSTAMVQTGSVISATEVPNSRLRSWVELMELQVNSFRSLEKYVNLHCGRLFGQSANILFHSDDKSYRKTCKQ